MENIKKLQELGYILENVGDRIIRVKNTNKDTVCTVFIQSGFSLLTKDRIFNHLNEVREGIKKDKYNFLKL